MITINECRRLIDPQGKKYSEEELHWMLAYLTELARTVTDHLKREDHEKKSRTDGPRVQR